MKPLVLSSRFDTMTELQDVLMHEGGRAAFLPDYLRSRHAARRVELEAQMHGFDAVLTLSAPGEATLGIASQGQATFNRIWTALGVPCINLPGLLGSTGLPIGVQLIQRRYEDERLLQVASALSPLLCPQGISS